VADLSGVRGGGATEPPRDAPGPSRDHPVGAEPGDLLGIEAQQRAQDLVGVLAEERAWATDAGGSVRQQEGGAVEADCRTLGGGRGGGSGGPSGVGTSTKGPRAASCGSRAHRSAAFATRPAATPAACSRSMAASASTPRVQPATSSSSSAA